MKKLGALALVLAGLVTPVAANGNSDQAEKGRTVPNAVNLVVTQFVTAANRGDYATVCRLYSRDYLKSSEAGCRSLYRWGAHLYGPYDYRIVGRPTAKNGHWRTDLIRWQHPSFIELAREPSGWRIVAGGW